MKNFHANKKSTTSLKLFGTESEDPRVLEITTSKGSRGGIDTFASVCTIEDKGGYQIKTHAIHGDFFGRVQSVECSRVTDKAVMCAHSDALKSINDIIDAAREFYRAREKQ